ncbi:hypothetical protein ACFSVJ_12405 [Prauserella oleivorans]
MSSDEPETTPVDAEAPEQEPQRDQEATPERGAPRWLVLGSAAFAVAAFVVAAAFGVMWWTASADDSAAVAREREDVVRAAGRRSRRSPSWTTRTWTPTSTGRRRSPRAS